MLHAAREMAHRFDQVRLLLAVEPAAQLGQRRRQREQRHQLGGEGSNRQRKTS